MTMTVLYLMAAILLILALAYVIARTLVISSCRSYQYVLLAKHDNSNDPNECDRLAMQFQAMEAFIEWLKNR